MAGNMEIACSISTYTVKSGDSLGKIARENGVEANQLKAANPEIKGPKYFIKPGQKILLPSVECKMDGKKIGVSNPKETFRILYDLHQMAQRLGKGLPKYKINLRIPAPKE